MNAVGTTQRDAKPAEARVPPGVDPKFADNMDSLELVDEEGMARLRNMVDDAYATERRTLLEFERLEKLEDNPRPLDPEVDERFTRRSLTRPSAERTRYACCSPAPTWTTTTWRKDPPP